MAKVQNKSDVAKALAQGSEHLGSLAMWSLSGAIMPSTELKALFAKHGLDWDTFGLPEISAHQAFRKAVRLAKQENSERVLIRPIDRTGTEIVMGIVDEQKLKQTRDLKYSLLTRVIFDKANEAVKTDDGGLPKEKQNQVGLRIKTLFKRLRDYYTTRDFVRINSRAMNRHMETITMREHGGVYFVPAQHTDNLMKLRAVINDVGQSAFTVLPVWGDDQAKADLGRRAKVSLAEEIKELAEQIAEFKSNPPRRDTLKNRMEDFQEIRAKAAMYSNMLSIQVDDLEQGIGECEDVLKALFQSETERLEAKKGDGKAKVAKRKSKVSETIRRIRKIAGEPEDFDEAEELADLDEAEELTADKAVEAPTFDELVAETQEQKLPGGSVIVRGRKAAAKGKRKGKAA